MKSFKELCSSGKILTVYLIAQVAVFLERKVQRKENSALFFVWVRLGYYSTVTGGIPVPGTYRTKQNQSISRYIVFKPSKKSLSLCVQFSQ
jgi:hypothetical protein